MAIHIISDTTAELPASLASEYGIEIIPQYIHFGEDTFRDEIEISAQEFYARQAAAAELPKTSAPSPIEFTPYFERWLEDDPQGTIFCIHPSSEVSGTVRSAELARRQMLDRFPEADIRVVDTRAVSVGLGLMVLATARKAREQPEATLIESCLRAMMQTQRTFFVVDTLEFLAKGGRIGRASHLVGSLLDIKPILTLEDGVVESHSKTRTRKRSLARMFELVCQQAQPLKRNGAQLYLGVAHANCEAEARQLAEQLEQALEPDYSLLTINGPAIGVHAGPGSLAVSCLSVS